MRFKKCGELLLGNRFPPQMKEKVYRGCIRSIILYASETRGLIENER